MTALSCALLRQDRHDDASRMSQVMRFSKGEASVRTVELALELGQHQGDGLGSSGGGGHNVEGGGAGAAQVAVAGVQQPLVTGVAVGGCHGALHDAKLLVQHLRRRQL